MRRGGVRHCVTHAAAGWGVGATATRGLSTRVRARAPAAVPGTAPAVALRHKRGEVPHGVTMPWTADVQEAHKHLKKYTLNRMPHAGKLPPEVCLIMLDDALSDEDKLHAFEQLCVPMHPHQIANSGKEVMNTGETTALADTPPTLFRAWAEDLQVRLKNDNENRDTYNLGHRELEVLMFLRRRFNKIPDPIPLLDEKSLGALYRELCKIMKAQGTRYWSWDTHDSRPPFVVPYTMAEADVIRNNPYSESGKFFRLCDRAGVLGTASQFKQLKGKLSSGNRGRKQLVIEYQTWVSRGKVGRDFAQWYFFLLNELNMRTPKEAMEGLAVAPLSRGMLKLDSEIYRRVFDVVSETTEGDIGTLRRILMYFERERVQVKQNLLPQDDIDFLAALAARISVTMRGEPATYVGPVTAAEQRCVRFRTQPPLRVPYIPSWHHSNAAYFVRADNLWARSKRMFSRVFLREAEAQGVPGTFKQLMSGNMKGDASAVFWNWVYDVSDASLKGTIDVSALLGKQGAAVFAVLQDTKAFDIIEFAPGLMAHVGQYRSSADIRRSMVLSSTVYEMVLGAIYDAQTEELARTLDDAPKMYTEKRAAREILRLHNVHGDMKSVMQHLQDNPCPRMPTDDGELRRLHRVGTGLEYDTATAVEVIRATNTGKKKNRKRKTRMGVLMANDPMVTRDEQLLDRILSAAESPLGRFYTESEAVKALVATPFLEPALAREADPCYSPHANGELERCMLQAQSIERRIEKAAMVREQEKDSGLTPSGRMSKESLHIGSSITDVATWEQFYRIVYDTKLHVEGCEETMRWYIDKKANMRERWHKKGACYNAYLDMSSRSRSAVRAYRRVPFLAYPDGFAEACAETPSYIEAVKLLEKRGIRGSVQQVRQFVVDKKFRPYARSNLRWSSSLVAYLSDVTSFYDAITAGKSAPYIGKNQSQMREYLTHLTDNGRLLHRLSAQPARPLALMSITQVLWDIQQGRGSEAYTGNFSGEHLRSLKKDWAALKEAGDKFIAPHAKEVRAAPYFTGSVLSVQRSMLEAGVSEDDAIVTISQPLMSGRMPWIRVPPLLSQTIERAIKNGFSITEKQVQNLVADLGLPGTHTQVKRLHDTIQAVGVETIRKGKVALSTYTKTFTGSARFVQWMKEVTQLTHSTPHAVVRELGPQGPLLMLALAKLGVTPDTKRTKLVPNSTQIYSQLCVVMRGEIGKRDVMNLQPLMEAPEITTLALSLETLYQSIHVPSNAVVHRPPLWGTLHPLLLPALIRGRKKTELIDALDKLGLPLSMEQCLDSPGNQRKLGAEIVQAAMVGYARPQPDGPLRAWLTMAAEEASLDASERSNILGRNDRYVQSATHTLTPILFHTHRAHIELARTHKHTRASVAELSEEGLHELNKAMCAAEWPNTSADWRRDLLYPKTTPAVLAFKKEFAAYAESTDETLTSRISNRVTGGEYKADAHTPLLSAAMPHVKGDYPIKVVQAAVMLEQVLTAAGMSVYHKSTHAVFLRALFVQAIVVEHGYSVTTQQARELQKRIQGYGSSELANERYCAMLSQTGGATIDEFRDWLGDFLYAAQHLTETERLRRHGPSVAAYDRITVTVLPILFLGASRAREDSSLAAVESAVVRCANNGVLYLAFQYMRDAALYSAEGKDVSVSLKEGVSLTQVVKASAAEYERNGRETDAKATSRSENRRMPMHSFVDASHREIMTDGWIGLETRMWLLEREGYPGSVQQLESMPHLCAEASEGTADPVATKANKTLDVPFDDFREWLVDVAGIMKGDDPTEEKLHQFFGVDAHAMAELFKQLRLAPEKVKGVSEDKLQGYYDVCVDVMQKRSRIQPTKVGSDRLPAAKEGDNSLFFATPEWDGALSEQVPATPKGRQTGQGGNNVRGRLLARVVESYLPSSSLSCEGMFASGVTTPKGALRDPSQGVLFDKLLAVADSMRIGGRAR